jgi:hypothetical protein
MWHNVSLLHAARALALGHKSPARFLRRWSEPGDLHSDPMRARKRLRVVVHVNLEVCYIRRLASLTNVCIILSGICLAEHVN